MDSKPSEVFGDKESKRGPLIGQEKQKLGNVNTAKILSESESRNPAIKLLDGHVLTKK